MGEFGIVVEVSAVHSDTNDGHQTCHQFPAHHAHCPSLIEDCPLGTVSSASSTSKSPMLKESQSCTALNAMWSATGTTSTTSIRSASTGSESSSSFAELQPQLRAFIAKTAKHTTASKDTTTKPSIASSRSRYAVKQLRKDLYLKKRVEAAKDLAREAKFLSCLQHPNIVTLRGTVSQPGLSDFMIVLDHLYTTLSEHLARWHDESPTPPLINIPWPIEMRSQQQIELEARILTERLLALYDVSQAMRYLYQKRYVGESC